MNITEFSLSVDDFRNPKRYTGNDSVMLILTRLFLLEPGTIQSHPDAGLGANSRYKYAVTDEVASALSGAFKSQIEKYIPRVQSAQVDVTTDEKNMHIVCNIDGQLYGLEYNYNSSKIKSDYVALADLQ